LKAPQACHGKGKGGYLGYTAPKVRLSQDIYGLLEFRIA
jgi:uncharacterized protein YjbI with pentapeptide repeats